MQREARQATTSAVPGVPFSSTPTAAPSPTSTSPATDPSFAFLPIGNVTSCGSYDIRWVVSNPGLANLTGVGINLGIALANGDNSTHPKEIIATNLPVLRTHFTWEYVDVHPEEYQMYGRWSDGHGAAAQSQVFDVKTGKATDCHKGIIIVSAMLGPGFFLAQGALIVATYINFRRRRREASLSDPTGNSVSVPVFPTAVSKSTAAYSYFVMFCGPGILFLPICVLIEYFLRWHAERRRRHQDGTISLDGQAATARHRRWHWPRLPRLRRQPAAAADPQQQSNFASASVELTPLPPSKVSSDRAATASILSSTSATPLLPYRSSYGRAATASILSSAAPSMLVPDPV